MTKSTASSSFKVTPLLLKRSLITMLLVGTVLNLINQTDGLLGNAPLNVLNLLLTYLVPFLVSITSGLLTLKECQDEHRRDE
ncbi:hypothetical protein J3L16_05810 [Alteromonas sp. 5E99-2]|uniref:hypothetical protein n=1 Tax=Alteromonas sp. 5E99-2 TaxID=2817683 RepID=UPI001A97F121|nr:hypothetical protein [Alteromonas sp. 5E99-2]MBO1255199.1 hypothetical protein [Alteromonas sp. 5E99-2]